MTRGRPGILGIGPFAGVALLLYAVVVRSRFGAGSYFSWGPSSRPLRLAAAVVAILVGSVAYVLSLRALRRARGQNKLAKNGPYRYTRHPLYASWVFGFLPALGLVSQCWLQMGLIVVGYAAFRMLVPLEERALEDEFGEGYAEYRAVTPCIVPLPRRRPKGKQ